MPEIHAHNPTAMNKPTLVWTIGTPTARALRALPPTAKIQLPTRVRKRIQVPSATSASHHKMLTLTSVPPTLNVDAKIERAELKPAMLEISFVATFPVTSRVTARLAPCSMRNVPSVTKKLGRPVRTSNQPLKAPIASETSSAKPTPTQTFVPS